MKLKDKLNAIKARIQNGTTDEIDNNNNNNNNDEGTAFDRVVDGVLGHGPELEDAKDVEQLEVGYYLQPRLTAYVDQRNQNCVFHTACNPMCMTLGKPGGDMDLLFYLKNISIQQFVDYSLKNENEETLELAEQQVQRHCNQTKKIMTFGKDKESLADYISSYRASQRQAANLAAYALAKEGLPRGVVHLIVDKLPGSPDFANKKDSVTNRCITKGINDRPK